MFLSIKINLQVKSKKMQVFFLQFLSKCFKFSDFANFEDFIEKNQIKIYQSSTSFYYNKYYEIDKKIKFFLVKKKIQVNAFMTMLTRSQERMFYPMRYTGIYVYKYMYMQVQYTHIIYQQVHTYSHPMLIGCNFFTAELSMGK